MIFECPAKSVKTNLQAADSFRALLLTLATVIG
jgi:hypothetical protein